MNWASSVPAVSVESRLAISMAITEPARWSFR
jgi:hypothetical protein